MTPIEQNTLAAMRCVLDPTKSTLELHGLALTSDFDQEPISFDAFSPEFFEAVAADEILSIYDQGDVRKVLELSCDLLPNVASVETLDHPLFVAAGIESGEVVCCDLFLLMNPACEANHFSDVLLDYQSTDEALTRSICWAAFVYNPRGQFLFQECHNAKTESFQSVLFEEILHFVKDIAYMVEEAGDVVWTAWVEETHRDAQIDLPKIEMLSRTCVSIDWKGKFDYSDTQIHSNDTAGDVANSFDAAILVQDNLSFDELASRYMNMARWARAMARRQNQPEPTFSIERIL